MGGFINSSTGCHVSRWQRALLGRHGLAGVLLATCLTATPTLAQTPTVENPDSQTHHAVSTSPSPPAAPARFAGVSSTPPANTAPDVPPLTRAAARVRIEEMSPIRWLANYGNVSIGQRE
jgi:hypothetical protein